MNPNSAVFYGIMALCSVATIIADMPSTGKIALLLILGGLMVAYAVAEKSKSGGG